LAYLLGLLGAACGVYWWRVRPEVPRRLVAATAAGLVLFAVWSGLQALPYLKVVEDHPEARRDELTVRFYSPPARSFLLAPPESVLWGEATAAGREKVSWAPEMALFPGVTVTLLALAGLATPVLARRWRAGLGAAAVGSAVLAMGFEFFDGALTYGILYRLPGWESIRTPGRLFTLTSLALALLAGAGAEGLARGAVGKALSGHRQAALALALPALLSVALLAEGLGRPAGDLVEPELRRFPEAGPQLHLPSDDFSDVQYMFWSLDGFPEIVNGYSGFTPRLQQDLRREMANFPDLASVERLQDLGVRTVVLHTDRSAGSPWAGAGSKPVDGLGLRRTTNGRMVVFEVEPGRGEGGEG
jgi:hypothetical protein